MHFLDFQLFQIEIHIFKTDSIIKVEGVAPESIKLSNFNVIQWHTQKHKSARTLLFAVQETPQPTSKREWRRRATTKMLVLSWLFSHGVREAAKNKRRLC